MEAITQIESASVVLATENIDTDQIIPAQFLTTTSREGLGQHAFHHWRYDDQGNTNPDFPLNQEAFSEANILVAGRNFGCGSSREHAPWALLDAGIKVVISSEIADIFRNNSLKNGLLPVIVDEGTHHKLLEEPGKAILVDLPSKSLRFDGETVHFDIDDFSHHCLLNGLDQLAYILEQEADIAHYEKEHA